MPNIVPKLTKNVLPNGSFIAPSDWLDISNTQSGQIEILASDISPFYYFNAYNSVGQNIIVDWGDGNIVTYGNGGPQQHTYTIGTGTPCSEGYTTWKIRMYSEFGAPILYIANSDNRFGDNRNEGALSVNINTDIGNATYICCNWKQLRYVYLPQHWGIVNDLSSTWEGCNSLVDIRWPDTMNSFLSAQSGWSGTKLKRIKFPSTPNAVSLVVSFYRNPNLEEVIFQGNMDNLTNIYCFTEYCYNLRRIVFPASMRGFTSFSSYAFYGNTLIEELLNLENVGSLTQDVDFNFNGDGYTNFSNVLHPITITARVGRFQMFGSKISNLTLTNTNSTFSGPSPQIDISGSRLDRTKLVALFTFLAGTGNFSGKAIKVTGCDGASSLTGGDLAIITNAGGTVIN